MNKSHKTVWNTSKEQWVVASEVAKSRGGKKSLSRVALAIVASLATMVPALAQTTTITGTVTAPVSTTDNVVDAHSLNMSVTTNNSQSAAITVSSAGTATVVITDVDVTSQASSSSYNTTSAFSISGGTGVSVHLDGNNTMTLVSANNGGPAFLASTESGSGAVSIDIADTLNVTNNIAGYWPDAQDGLRAVSKDGDVTVTHSGIGTIKTVGGSAIAAYASGSGDVVVTLQGSGGKDSIELETTGGLNYSEAKGNHGISAAIVDTNNKTGQALVTSDAKITTTGTYADGIRTQAQGGLVSVDNSGTITVLGANSTGINAVNDGGDIFITNSGDISAANGIGISANTLGGAVLTDGSETGSIVISDLGNNTITGSLRGIKATGGEVSVISDSNIVVQYTGAANEVVVGIEAVSSNSAGTTYAEYNGAGITVTSNATGGSSYVKGIYASNKGADGDPVSTGDSTVVVDGNVSVVQNSGGASQFIYGIEAASYGAGDAIVHHKSGTIEIELSGGSTVDWGNAINAQAFANGNVYVQTDNGTIINTTGDNLNGVHLTSQDATSGAPVLWGDIDSVITTSGDDSRGIWVTATNGAEVDLTNRGDITTSGIGSDGIGISNWGTGISELVNIGDITTSGVDARAIYVSNFGEVNLTNTGSLLTSAAGAEGIYVDNWGNDSSTIINTGNIVTGGQNSHAIIVSGNGDVSLSNSGNLTTADGSAAYVRSNNGNVAVISTGNITATQTIASTQSHGVDAGSLTGITTVSYDQGTIKVIGNTSGGGDAIGIVSGDGASGDAGQQSYINLGSGAIVDASSGVGALLVNSNGYGEINIANGAQVLGGSYGIQMRGTGTAAGTYVINNAGEIDALSDMAIQTDGQAGSTLEVNNYGTITGYVQSGITRVTFNNYSSNSLNLRNFYDSDADGIADTKGVSISTFGGGTFNNAVTGTVRLMAVSGETFVNTAGEYIPTGGALSTSTSGIVQAQLLNLVAFNNSGVIDLTASGKAGDVLVVSGGGTAGTYGGGQYISNGGSLLLDTRLNGGSLGYSDVLVVDDAILGTGATRIYITPTADSVGGFTSGDGIKLIEVLGTTDSGAFVLGAPVVYGAYEYILSTGLSAGNEQNWYLRNTSSNGKLLINPSAGAYLGNQYAAATMFNHNILDRRESIRMTDDTVWVRLNHSESASHLLDGQQEVNIQTSIIQLGADLLDKEDYVAGIFGGYGNSKVDNRSRQTTSYAGGDVDGYQLGVYASWLPNEHVGPYADAWAAYGWYKNKLRGTGSVKDERYNSNGYALSLEAGYGFELDAQENGDAWILKPHLQVIYSNIDNNSFIDSNNMRYSGGRESGIQTRVGARLYGKKGDEEKGLIPFIEANWLHDTMGNSVYLDDFKAQSNIGKNVAELKLGVQGQISENFSLWGHIGAQRGSDRFTRDEIQFGLRYRWK